jgi:hypothetical protein
MEQVRNGIGFDERCIDNRVTSSPSLQQAHGWKAIGKLHLCRLQMLCEAGDMWYSTVFSMPVTIL